MDICKQKTTILIESIESILNYQPTNVQRLLNEEHVQQLVNDQIHEFEQFGCFSILQSITCADYLNKRYILDGQHRVAAFKVLKSMMYPLLQQIPLVVYQTNSVEELRRYYIRINKHHPINPLEISESWFTYGKEFCVWLKNAFSAYIKYSEKTCNCPNINLREMMDYIKRMRVFERLQQNEEPLVALKHTILELNTFVTDNYNHMKRLQLSSDSMKRLHKCYEKQESNPCFLGVWRQFEWLEICVYLITQNATVSTIDLSIFCNDRQRIPKTLRLQVWKKRNGNCIDGQCFVCENDLHIENMECGHVVSHVYHGSVSIDNLEPICKTCNRDMGIMNLNEYKSILNK